MRKEVCRGILLYGLLVFSFAIARSQTCPTDVPDNSALNGNGLPSSWAPNANITAWIDSSAIPQGTPLYLGIRQSLAAWASYLRQSGGNITLLAGSGIPATGVLPSPYYIVSVGDAGNKNAFTTWDSQNSDGTVLDSTTFFDYDWQDMNNAGILTQAQAEDRDSSAE